MRLLSAFRMLLLGAVVACAEPAAVEVPEVIRQTVITVTVIPEDAVVTIHQTLQLHAELSPRFTRDLTWTTSDSSAAVINAHGLLTALAAGIVGARACVAEADGRSCGTARITVR